MLTLSYINTALSQSAFRIYKCYIIKLYLNCQYLTSFVFLKLSLKYNTELSFVCHTHPMLAARSVPDMSFYSVVVACIQVGASTGQYIVLFL